jgi:hypothetical protein
VKLEIAALVTLLAGGFDLRHPAHPSKIAENHVVPARITLYVEVLDAGLAFQ